MAIVTGVGWYDTVAVIGICLNIGKFEQLFLFPLDAACACSVPVETGFLKVSCVLNSFASTHPRALLEGRCYFQPRSPGWNLSLRAVATRRQHFITPASGSFRHQSLSQSGVPEMEITVNGPAETPKSFCLIASSFSPSPGLIPRPATPRCAVGWMGGGDSKEKGWSWEP